MPTGEDLTDLLSEYADEDADLAERTGDLGQVVALANAMLHLADQVALAEAHLSVLKEQHREMEQDRLPEAMLAIGLTELKLEDDSKITIKEQLQTSFKADMKDAALQWLANSGHGSIIKHVVSVDFGKGENDRAHEAISALQEAGFEPADKQDVHYQTLQSWGRNQAQEGERPPEDYFNVFDLKIAKVQKPRKKK